jgi:hypothetical protein
MTDSFQDRDITQVSVEVSHQVVDALTENAAEGLGCEVTLSLRGRHSTYGPTAVLTFAIPPMMDATLSEIEAAALGAAHNLLTRLSREGQAELSARRSEMIQDDLKPLEFNFS